MTYNQYGWDVSVKIFRSINSIDELGLFWAYQHCENVYQLLDDTHTIVLAEDEQIYIDCESWKSVCDILYAFEYGIEITEALHYDDERLSLLSIPMHDLYEKEYPIVV